MGNFYGVLVGVDFYPACTTGEAPSLSCAVKDAEVVFARLASHGPDPELHLLLNEDATVHNVQHVIGSLPDLGNEDTFFLMFSGHGGPHKIKEATDESPADYEPVCLTSEFVSGEDLGDGEDLAGGFTLRDVRKWLGNRAPGNIVVLLDSCFSGTAVSRELPYYDEPMYMGGRTAARGLRARLTRLGAKAKTEAATESDCEIAGTLNIDERHIGWPSGSEVVVLTATKKGRRAYEIEDVGHGLLTTAFLEWLREEAQSDLRNRKNLGDVLLGYANRKLGELEAVNGKKWLEYQQPDGSFRGQVRIDSLLRGIETHDAGRAVFIDRILRPSQREDESRSKEHARNSDIFNALTSDARELRESNIVVRSEPFMGMTFLVDNIVDEVQQRYQKEDRPLVRLATGYIQAAFPFICASATWLEQCVGLTAITQESPLFGRDLFGMIDSRVQTLARRRAAVIVSYRSETAGPEVEYFLARCMEQQEIRLCIVLHADEAIPVVLRTKPHRRISITPPSDGEEPFVDPEVNKRVQCLPRRVRTARLAKWLTLLERDKLSAQQTRAFEDDANPVAVYIDIIRDVLARVEDQESGETTLLLLKALSTAKIPRTVEFVESVWGRLQTEQLVSSDAKLEAHLTRLVDSRLIDVRDPPDEAENKPKVDERLFFVHYLVQQAAMRDVKSCERGSLHRIVGHSYERMLTNGTQRNRISHRWPDEVIAHQAAMHFVLASEFDLAAKSILTNWKGLVDGGYHEQLLEWVRKFRRCLDTETHLRVLLNVQSLRRHRQEWDDILDIHGEIARRCGARRVEAGGGWALPPNKRALARYFWTSQVNVGHFYMVQRDYIRALAEYREFIDWFDPNSPDQEDWSLGLYATSLIRSAHCLVLAGDYECAESTIGLAEQFVEDAGFDEPVRQLRHQQLRTVKIDFARLNEDSHEVHKLAIVSWKDSMTATSKRAEERTFDRAIAHVHVGWAALLRGEYQRAWRHARRARQLFNKRGIAEYWWVCEAERVGTLAIAWSLRARAAFPIVWPANSYSLPTASLIMLSDERTEQEKCLRALIKLCGRENGWRAAELKSALGQLLIASNRPDDGAELLWDSLGSAQDFDHRVLESYVLEALAQVPDHRGLSESFWRESAQIAASFELRRPGLRRIRNWAASRRDGMERRREWDTDDYAVMAKLAHGEFLDDELQTLVEHVRGETDGAGAATSRELRLRKKHRFASQRPIVLTLGSDEHHGVSIDISDQGICCLFAAAVAGIPERENMQPPPTELSIEVGSDDDGYRQRVRVTKYRTFSLDPPRSTRDEMFQRRGYCWGIACQLGTALPIVEKALQPVSTTGESGESDAATVEE